MSRLAGWWPFGRGDVVAVTLRAVVVAAPLLAVAFTRVAAGSGRPVVAIAVAALALVCARRPDNHVGLAVVLVVGGNWVATVDDVATPWAVAVAAALAAFHAAVAAAGVTAPLAPWTPAMIRRWARRAGILMATGAATWAVVALLDGRAGGGRAVVSVTVLAALAAAALWARGGTARTG